MDRQGLGGAPVVRGRKNLSCLEPDRLPGGHWCFRGWRNHCPPGIDINVAVGFTAKFHQQCPCGSIFVAAVIGCDNHYTDGIVVFRIQSAQVVTDQGTVLPVMRGSVLRVFLTSAVKL